MSKTNAFETAFLNLIAANSNIANLGDATGVRGSTTAGSLYLSLHTADPGEAGTQATNEIAYTSYARVAKARDGVALTVTGDTLALAASTSFPAGTGGSGTAAFWGLGVASTGAGTLLWKGSISPTIVCGNGVTPQLNAGNMVVED